MKARCEKCGAATGDLDYTAQQLVRALEGISRLMMLESGAHEEDDTANICNLFEYLAIPLDNAVVVADKVDMKGGAKGD